MPAAVGTLTLAGQAVTLTKTTAAAGTTLDPAKTSSFITLSNSNRTATRSTGTAAYVTTLSTKSGVTAELYVEATNTAGVDSGIGVSNAPMADSDSGGTINWLGWNGNSIGLYRDSIYLNGALVDSLPTTPNATDVIAVDVDRVGQEIWFRNVTKGEAWVPGGASGIDISSIGSGALYFGFTLSNPDSKTVNFDGTFVGAVPPAAVRWDGTAISGVTHYTMPATVGTLTLAGQTATLRTARKTAAGLGTITLAGQAAGLRVGHAPLLAGLGTLTLAGQLVTTRFAHRVVAGLGTLTLAGQTAIVRYAHKMPAGVGALTLNGQNVTLRYSRKMPAGLGTVTLSGVSVNLVYSGSGSKTLIASIGTLTLGGQPVTLRTIRKMPAARGTITLAGQIVALQRARKITVDPRAIVLEGKAAGLIYGAHVGYTLTAATGVLGLTGCDVTLPVTRRPPTIVQENLKFGRSVYVSRW